MFFFVFKGYKRKKVDLLQDGSNEIYQRMVEKKYIIGWLDKKISGGGGPAQWSPVNKRHTDPEHLSNQNKR